MSVCLSFLSWAFILRQESSRSSSPLVHEGPRTVSLGFGQKLFPAMGAKPFDLESVHGIRISFFDNNFVDFPLYRTEIDMANIPATAADQMMMMARNFYDIPIFGAFPVDLFQNPHLHKKIDGPKQGCPSQVRFEISRLFCKSATEKTPGNFDRASTIAERWGVSLTPCHSIVLLISSTLYTIPLPFSVVEPA